MQKDIWTVLVLLTLAAGTSRGDSLGTYTQTNLVSDLPGVAASLDTNLVNPWGITAGPTSPFWINDNGAGLATIYHGSGGAVPVVPGGPASCNSNCVTVPPPMGGSGPAAPTGIAFNGTANNFGGSHFIFSTEDGTISAWTSGPTAALEATAPTGSVYKGLAIAGNSLVAANFGLGRVDVFNSSFQPVAGANGFADPNLPAGYAPFDIQLINGNLYVTYALQDGAKHDDVAGPGNGFVDVFSTNGQLIRRLTSQGPLNSPWGLTLAPSQFGAFSGDLLVGNFGDGTINAFDPNTGQFIGSLRNPDGTPLVIDGLWGLSFGNGAQGQGLDSLYFTAGIPGPDSIEDHGLFGSLDPTPEPSSILLVAAAGLVGILGTALQRMRTFVSRS